MKLTAKANAKINLTLDIVGVREDGYHLVDMIMQSVSLYDTVTVEKKESGITVNSSDNTLGGEDDITYKAAKLFFESSSVSGGANISILKNIPVAAGLGGGSSNAAAVLLLLNKIYGNPLSNEHIEKISVKLGADVPFFLYGGTISVTGIGEIFEKLSNMPKCYLVIAKKGIKPSTKKMYEIIDSTEVSSFRPDNKGAKKAIADNDLKGLCSNIKNVFSAAWEPDIITDILSENNALAVSLSGSGPSYFGIFTSRTDAENSVEMLKGHGIIAHLAEPTASAIEIV